MVNLNDIGIALPYGASGEVRTTCPRCDNKCLSVKVRDGIWYCHYCGWKGGLRSRHNGHTPPTPITSRSREPNRKARQAIERVWRESRQISEGDPVHCYLQKRRLNFCDICSIQSVLRYHPRLSYYHGDDNWTHHPAMVAPVLDPHGAIVSIHRTFLTTEGHKADVDHPKKLMTPGIRGATKGGAIRLYPAEEILGVAEGIETALAVRLATELPVWATISAIGMASLVLRDAVQTVVIFADNDISGTGQEKANDLARRMLTEGKTVKILMPKTPGQDWADVVGQEVGR